MKAGILMRNEQKIKEGKTKVADLLKKGKDITLVDSITKNTQAGLRGPKTLYGEDLQQNIMLIGKSIPADDLLVEIFNIGSTAEKQIALVYIESKAEKGLLDEVKRRISSIKTEFILEMSYLERNIENSNQSPFPQTEITNRPDVTAVGLMQGRIALFIEGSSDVMIVPTTFFDLMDTPDDAYGRWYFAGSFFRIARYIMFIFAASLPGFYIALTSYNLEMIPTELLLLISASQEDTAFPIYFEAFLMMGVVEAVRMMMVRMPSQLGSTIALFTGIALIGAGLAANIIGAPITIIVTLTVISSFSIPSYDLRTAIRIIQFFTMIMSTILGIFGYAIAFFYIVIHVVTLKSFGIPYLAPVAPLNLKSWGHTILRENTVIMPEDETYKSAYSLRNRGRKRD